MVIDSGGNVDDDHEINGGGDYGGSNKEGIAQQWRQLACCDVGVHMNDDSDDIM